MILLSNQEQNSRLPFFFFFFLKSNNQKQVLMERCIIRSFLIYYKPQRMRQEGINFQQSILLLYSLVWLRANSTTWKYSVCVSSGTSRVISLSFITSLNLRIFSKKKNLPIFFNVELKTIICIICPFCYVELKSIICIICSILNKHPLCFHYELLSWHVLLCYVLLALCDIRVSCGLDFP